MVAIAETEAELDAARLLVDVRLAVIDGDTAAVRVADSDALPVTDCERWTETVTDPLRLRVVE